MGVFSMSTSRLSTPGPPPPAAPPIVSYAKRDPRAPDPSRWTPLRHVTINGSLIMDVRYPNCTNYEGRKILLFDKGVTVQDLFRQELLDPHFSNEGSYIHPVARFEPTDRGWGMAITCAQEWE